MKNTCIAVVVSRLTRAARRRTARAIALCSLLLAAGCGASHTAKQGPSPAADTSLESRVVVKKPQGSGYLHSDGDKDGDDDPRNHGNDDIPFMDSYGPRASASETNAIAAVVKRYYAAAAAADGTRACRLLSAKFIAALVEGQGPGAHSCATVVGPLLQEQRDHFAVEEVPTMTVIAVRAKGTTALAVLGFKSQVISQTVLAREGHAWKLDALLDSFMT